MSERSYHGATSRSLCMMRTRTHLDCVAGSSPPSHTGLYTPPPDSRLHPQRSPGEALV